MKTAIISLDLINDLCHADGKFAAYADRIEQSGVIANTNKITGWAREHQHLIFHVKLSFRQTYIDSSTHSPLFRRAKENHAFQLSTWGTSFHESLIIEDNDIEIIKHRVSAFYGTDLDLILRANQIEKLILCGIATNNAVELTAREAHDRDYCVVVATDATQTASDEEQQASLRFLAKITGLQTAEDITN